MSKLPKMRSLGQRNELCLLGGQCRSKVDIPENCGLWDQREYRLCGVRPSLSWRQWESRILFTVKPSALCFDSFWEHRLEQSLGRGECVGCTLPLILIFALDQSVTLHFKGMRSRRRCTNISCWCKECQQTCLQRCFSTDGAQFCLSISSLEATLASSQCPGEQGPVRRWAKGKLRSYLSAPEGLKLIKVNPLRLPKVVWPPLLHQFEYLKFWPTNHCQTILLC